MSLPAYPTGWYAFGLASELSPGAVLSRPFMGEDLVWENKQYRERPALAVGDGPIGLYRRWARQFYEDAASLERSPARGAPLASTP